MEARDGTKGKAIIATNTANRSFLSSVEKMLSELSRYGHTHPGRLDKQGGKKEDLERAQEREVETMNQSINQSIEARDEAG